MKPSFSSERAALVRITRWAILVNLALIASPLLWGAFLFMERPPGVWIFGPQITGILVAFLLRRLWRAGRFEQEVEGHTTASAEGISLDGRLILPRARIRTAVLVPRAGRPPVVRIERRGINLLPVKVRVADEAEGRGLLYALGQHASQTVAAFHVPKPRNSSVYWALILPVVGILGGGLSIAWASLWERWGRPEFMSPLVSSIPTMFIMALLLWPAKLVVGADGLLLSFLGRRQFIPYRDIAIVAPCDEPSIGIELTLRSGDSVRIPVDPHARPGKNDRATILARIREAVAHHQQHDPAAAAALLARGDTDLRSWIQRLRALGAGANVDHRTAPVPTDTLLRIVEDAGAGPQERLGAAIALKAASLDEAEQQRLTAAANATAAPKLRIALEAAQAEDEAALLEAMADLDAPQPRSAIKAS